MTAIGQSLGGDVCKTLPGIHALTGCDSTSAFVGKRQKASVPLRLSPTQTCALP